MCFKDIQILNLIRNTQNIGINSFYSKFSQSNLLILNLLKREGFISYFQIIESKKRKKFRVFLNYENKTRFYVRPKKTFLKIFSKKDFWKISSKEGCVFFKTSLGVSCDRKAKILNQGGDVMFYAN